MLRVSSILIGLLATGSVQASAASKDVSAAGVAEVTAACQGWDGSRFSAATELFGRATTDEPANATTFCRLGTAQLHRMLQMQTAPADPTHNTAAKGALDAAVDALTLAAELDHRHAESYALRGTVCGARIGEHE